ncbi:unnamed protein product [Spirodela intermedia]|uniref:Uncharacterized protein n=1 Tax=Spirodela intermedia TaxID=51605 RepID=A0A7I8IZ10_SPIIN|nr:unnamed protein product [Spirodela intermedia]CAA6663204.1 unnamed protein product [Spirodela intermedia]
METPSSTRRVTRSQASSLASEISGQEGGTTLNPQSSSSSSSRSRAAVLVDITNDSPIVGIAAASLKTPPSAAAGESKLWIGGRTPCSGEAILRGQVKNLLQKVEEEEGEPFLTFLGHLAPTTTNTPQIVCLSGDEPEPVPASPRGEDGGYEFPEVINGGIVLFLPLSARTSQETVCPEEVPTEEEDGCSSAWSLQAYDGSSLEDGDGSEWTEEDEEDDDEEEEDEDDGRLVDLCEGVRTMSMGQSELPEFAGKHTRFTYDSDGEIVAEVEVTTAAPSSVLRLRGMPAPEGKHLRFQEEEED